MCNENMKEYKNGDTLNILLYRIDRLEEERKRENKEIMEILHIIQENQSHTNEKIVKHTTELTRVNARLDKLENGKVDMTEFDGKCDAIAKRLDNYNKVIFGLIIGVGVIIISDLIKLI